ncbi:thiamine pyrophosphate-binding protein [Amycolatopsis cihanbeyliensis]|uniref:Thiamine pyrophosphate-dependent acetolactate synthase large subunit-like protein n=1 Tax=Amycolatopsis cihanbeyliensis TaxID=1128664 RepID=A0A542DEZ9_AMYCI|nr:thiamine pyrophosphate-binding protein [Amycolatopsis cihanbeyliensis]TQJ01620.1 thiamine pyrophosphate-dependent acetolactate synthase large subunit-like protein [Amycolatopsis cihanbeyliensis]
MNLLHAVARLLRQSGTQDMFGVLGSGNLAFVNLAIDQYGMRYHALRHESAAVAAADAFARVTGQVGVATVTHGPGLTHASSAIVEAAKSAVPLLVVTSSVSRRAPHQNQALDQASVVRALGAAAFLVAETEDARQTVLHALRHARSQGLTVLMLPEDLHDEQVKAVNSVSAEIEVAAAEEVASPADLGRAARLLMDAARPVVVAGRGAMRAVTIAHLRDIGRYVGALLFTTLPAKDRFADDDYDAGICGVFGTASLVDLAEDADVVLVVGSSLSSWTTRQGRLFSGSAIIRCDSNAATAGRGEAVFLGGDAASVISELSSLVQPTGRAGYRGEGSAATLRSARADVHHDESDGTGLDPRTLVQELGRRLPRQRSIVVDGGHFSGWPAMLVRTPPPGLFVYAHGYQCVGLALGNVVGVAIGAPSNLPIAFIGDGGLLMSLGELHAIGDLDMPVLVVVLNDGAYGAEYHQAEPGHAGPTMLRRENLATVAKALGGTGISVRQMSDLDKLSQWFDAPQGLCLVDCHVTRAVRAAWLQGR